MQVDNHVANELLLAVRRGERTQDFMNAVSGVDGYNLRNHDRQGHIRGIFAKELIAEQFLLRFDEIISTFWCGVFEQLDKAKLYGEIVEIKAPGVKKEYRPTSNNPIHFLRYHGKMAVRNYITSLYRKNLEYGCPTCGRRASVKNDKTCTKCGSIMVTTYKYVEEDETLAAIDKYCELDNFDTFIKVRVLLFEFMETVLGRGTRAYQIMRILIDPDASRDMCGSCSLCECTTFDIDACTNYNANIGRYLNINKSMAANKMRRIRYGLIKWLSNKSSDESKYLFQIIPDTFK